jgi:hypothetical protein
MGSLQVRANLGELGNGILHSILPVEAESNTMNDKQDKRPVHVGNQRDEHVTARSGHVTDQRDEHVTARSGHVKKRKWSILLKIHQLTFIIFYAKLICYSCTGTDAIKLSFK